GVPTKGQVAGIAMGVITGEGKIAVLSDIQGVEDALGDMDFKVAGTRRGVTAMKMDMKIKGISIDTMAGAIQQAKEGRFFIMDKMDAALRQPRSAMSQYAPRMITVQIHPDKIREVIGPGGKMIRKIIEDSGVTSIDIEDDGRVVIGSVNGESAAKAEQLIRDLTGEVEVGKNYRGKVVRIMPFGAFVQIMPNQDGLVHISQLAEERVERAGSSTATAAVDATTETKPVEKVYAGAPVPAYNGPRFGLRRPAELERRRSPVPQVPARPFADAGGPWSWAVRRADHDRRRGARAERGPAGGAIRWGGGQAARSAPARDRSLARRRLHHQHPEMPAAWQPGSAARRGGGLLAVPRAAAPTDQTGGRAGAWPARAGAPVAGV